MPSHTKPPAPPKKANRPKSSRAARQLIHAALARYKNERAATRALRLPNHGQLNKLKRGLIRDTPAMKAAIQRAKDRARRAYFFIPAPTTTADEHTQRCEQLRALAESMLDLLPGP